MKRALAVALLLISSPVWAQSTPPEKIKLELTPIELQVIVNGLNELPYKVSAPVMNVIFTQANEQAKKPIPPPEPSK